MRRRYDDAMNHRTASPTFKNSDGEDVDFMDVFDLSSVTDRSDHHSDPTVMKAMKNIVSYEIHKRHLKKHSQRVPKQFDVTLCESMLQMTRAW